MKNSKKEKENLHPIVEWWQRLVKTVVLLHYPVNHCVRV